MSSQLKVQELRDALAERGLDTSGTKAVLVARLDAYEIDKSSKKRDASVVDDGHANGGKRVKTDSQGVSDDKEIDGYTVVELRAALAKRGLSTAGTKKTLQSRLLEAINGDQNDKNDNFAKSGDNREEKEYFDEESKEDESKKDISSYSVADLRSALAERGLSTTGTKKTLHSRLLEAMRSSEADDTIEEDDGEDCDGKERNKEEKIVTSTKKGRAVLDNHLPDHIKSRFHVLETVEGIYDAMLNQTNVGDNNNKFYVIQVLESDDGLGQYYVYNRWGRVGAKGQDKLFGVLQRETAISEFEAKFLDKTRNTWAQRANFEPVKNKYTWLERDYNDDAEASESKAKDIAKKPSIPKAPKESKLDSRLAQFISCICSVDMMKQQMMEIGYDANKMPLGKLSKTTILKGYEALKRIAAVLEGSATGSLERLSSEFYTVIPHDFGFQRMSNFIIDTNPKLKRKLEMVEALGEIQLATKLLQDEDEEDPVYSSYQRLKCQLEPLEHSHEEFEWIKGYLQNTHAKTHASYGLEILQVFKASREDEGERFKKFAGVQNRMLLWHGSRLTNWTGILSQGLRIAPPEAPVTGYMFGKGVYFADMVSKSANYCCTSAHNPIGVLLLCEVALGDMRELQYADYNADKLPSGKLSTKGVGGTEPDSKESKVLPDGLIVPMGKPVQKNGNTGGLLYNEYIVYNVEQIRMRYVLQVKFKYRH
ncbi:hypothetical protein GOP47_0010485 [Adiantum capillus-veneris]|uniref:Poly [ADP-ribose] polymerase n=1 Tax=Adiantum capillus-veneris TaxID=13818 RepID=A0A9D4UUZ9_ADICA|nr:hypothetical protein GOP47_0010485 [Adiantum capillus-veneris]